MDQETVDTIASLLGSEAVQSTQVAVERVRRAGVVRSYQFVLADGRTEFISIANAEQIKHPAFDRERTVLLDRGEAGQLVVWRYPNDPVLTALPAVVDLAAISTILARLNLSSAPDGIELVSYRPLRSAVVRVLLGGEQYYLKVISPPLSTTTHNQHLILKEAGVPLPKLRAWSEEGLFLSHSSEGRPAGSLSLVELQGSPFNSSLASILDRIPEGAAGTKPPTTTRARYYASFFEGSSWEVQAKQIAHSIQQLFQAEPAAPRQVIHGDLHRDQLFVDENNAVIGIIDFDRVGWGRRSDDLAHLAAFEVHWNALNGGTEINKAELQDWMESLIQDFAVPREEFLPRFATGVLSHAASSLSRGAPDPIPALLNHCSSVLGLDTHPEGR